MKLRFIVVMLVVVGLLFPLLTTASNAASTQLSPSDDSWVDSNTPDSNYGNDIEIHVKSNGQTRRTYLKFDLSAVPAEATVTSAKLYLYCTAGNPSLLQVDVHETDDSWSEGAITWNNAPAIGAFVASNTTVNGLGKYYFWDITSYTQSQYLSDKILSLIVKFPLDDPGLNNPNYHRDFASKEYSGTSFDPYLEITYTPVVKYYLTVISPYGMPGGEGWYDNCTDAYATLNTDIIDHGNGTRRVFTHWSGDASGTNYACSDPIHMNQNKTAIANWKTQYYLTMSTNFGTVNPGDGWHDAGSIVSISATPPTTVSGERYVWNGWTGTGTGSYTGLGNPASVTMNAPVTETASWTHQYYLTVNSPHGTPGGEGWYDSGDTAYATVTPLTVSGPTGVQYVFTHWGDDASGTTSPSNPIVMDGPKTATASWKTQYYLTLTTTSGGVTDPASSAWYDSGSLVQVMAIPDTDYSFDHWELDAFPVGSANPYNVLMNDVHDLHAVFLYSPTPPPNYYLTVLSPYDTPDGEGWYVNGSTAYASLTTGIVDHGNGTRRVFTHWSGDASGTDYAQSEPITMNTNKTAVANWKTQYYLTVTSPYDTPSGEGWYDNGDTAYASLSTGTVDHGNGTRRIFTSWGGDASGTNYAQSDPILMDGPKTAIANWKTQYYLTVKTNPSGIVAIPGTGWYDESTNVPLTAPSVTGYTFLNWTVDGVSQGDGVKSIHIYMNAPHTATAHYKSSIVGGFTVSIKSPLHHTWISLNAMLIAAIFITMSWVKRRQRKTSKIP